MVARSQPPLRRSGRCGEQASRSNATSVTEILAPSAVILSHRVKRNRISSFSHAENLQKRRKIEHLDDPSCYKFPLRNRPNNEPSQSLPLKNGTKFVSAEFKKTNSTKAVSNPYHISQAAEQRTPQQQRHPQTNDKRSLRSQDGGSRSKSELSLYFTNYEQMLSLESAEPGMKTATDTVFSTDHCRPRHCKNTNHLD